MQALTEKRLGAAGLDVFVDEPRVPPALFTLDNIVLTPHIASNTSETLQAMMRVLLNNIDAFARTCKVLTPVVV